MQLFRRALWPTAILCMLAAIYVGAQARSLDAVAKRGYYAPLDPALSQRVVLCSEFTDASE